MKKVITVMLCVFLLLAMAGCAKCEADAGYRRGTYSGKLKGLVTNDFGQLYSFIYKGEFADTRGIVEISCKDYRLTRGMGAAGTADIFEGVFYEEGLVECAKVGEYDRFRKDYVFEIAEIRGNEIYWFVSYDDAEQWIVEIFR